MSNNPVHIALVGNPNSGKTSLFNALTGLHQRVGNFPGVTVDKKVGHCEIAPDLPAVVIDLPGTYSLYPRREDEWVAYRVLMQQDKKITPDMVVLVADASNLQRNLLFASQIIDLKAPVVVALTMLDIAKRKGIRINLEELERSLGVPVISINPRKNKGLSQLKKAIELTATQQYKVPARNFIESSALAGNAIAGVQEILPHLSDYRAIHYLINHESFTLPTDIQIKIEQVEQQHQFNHTRIQAEEILQRYHRIKQVMQHAVAEPDPMQKKLVTEKLDDVLLHRRWGYVILMAVLFILFQSIFWLAEYPMQFIEWTFAELGSYAGMTMADGWWKNLLVDGVLAGLSGILVFVPQIAILFGLITLLEDTGYMARISFLTDKLMRKVGLNGKSVMPMISGFACAVPAIMSARNIENKKERLLTILITPLMSCSARLPVYTILIALVIPQTFYFGFLSLQGLVMMGLYLLGLVMALAVSYVAKWFINIKEKSIFILELPVYRAPRWNNILITMMQKARIFIVDAGKIIMLISLVLWGLSNFGPSGRIDKIEASYQQRIQQQPDQKDVLEHEKRTVILENSYAGILGKAIEPAIRPLGYDWKIGIALITSFAAREVFVGTMATLYSVGEDESEESLRLREKMRQAKRPDGSAVYNLATGLSLMVFYAFAMQCMSTLAIARRETGGWRWPIIQLVYMTGLAYLMSLLVYQLLK